MAPVASAWFAFYQPSGVPAPPRLEQLGSRPKKKADRYLTYIGKDGKRPGLAMFGLV